MTPVSPRPRATRSRNEAIDVLAEQAPDLHQVLDQCREQGMNHVIVDARIDCDRAAGTTANGADLWYSGEAKRFAGNVRLLTAPDGTPLWASPVEPGSHHDLARARIHALPDLYPTAARGLPTLADVGYVGAGVGVHTPLRPTRTSPAHWKPTTAPITVSYAAHEPWANGQPPN